MPLRMSSIDLGNMTDRELLLLTAQHVNELCTHAALQNGRLAKLEEWRNQAIGVRIVLGVAIPAAVSWLIGKV